MSPVLVLAVGALCSGFVNRHHYAPLFLLRSAAKHPFVALIEDCRRTFPSLPCRESATA